MEQRTKGAWLVHHAQKLQLNTTTDFENVAFAGKAAILLSAISGSRQDVISNGKLRSLAKANGISAKTELPLLVDELRADNVVLELEEAVTCEAVSIEPHAVAARGRAELPEDGRLAAALGVALEMVLEEAGAKPHERRLEHGGKEATDHTLAGATLETLNPWRHIHPILFR